MAGLRRFEASVCVADVQERGDVKGKIVREAVAWRRSKIRFGECVS